MTEIGLLNQTIRHLEATAKSSELPASQKERGESLLQRLTSPIRMTLLGLPGSGKTELVNMLVGQRLMPAIPDLPTTELVYGDEPGCRVVYGDGSEVRMGWPEDVGFDWTDAVFVKVEYPLPILKDVSLLEIVTDGSPQDLSNALNWAIPRTDMTLWCTQEFSRLENALWVQVPDSLKDHGSLVVTRADELGLSGELPHTLKRLSTIAENEFQNLHAVATTHFLAAIGPDGKIEEGVRKSTGAGAILDAVMGDIHRGRQADMDAAEVFLARFGVDEIPPVETKAVAAKKNEVAVDSSPVPIHSSGDNEDDILSQALIFVQEKGIELSQLADEDEDIAETVLDTCTETVDHLVGLFSDGMTSTTQFSEEVEEAYEMLVLMQLEQGESSAADAATVVLQLKRELEMAQAA